MFDSGAAVAAALEAAGADLDDAQRQPNGVDLTVDAVFQQTEPGRLGRDGKRVGQRQELEPRGDCYRLERGSYVVRYGEPVRIPEERIGFVLPRSTLLRNACTLDTAVWDAGYEGVGEGRLDVGHPIEIEPGARIAQLVLAEADHEGTYDGAYQEENL
ncbi:deoxyuridine 5'-triphosphate nucleotidohydrolase [Halorubrum californiense DSM 19288]|uniref:Deoxyuridine 5'-triphosphate nucleotidohydrolase n=1 Tax=Halorubrum californiense DSM 19288 TaxID=1227465 RepID=M0E1C1_9EURY|nr:MULTISPECIES: deoxyuridine 5'-triphosphate nucleotidohydrolase [Halorubrum]ELZ41590.1 deoxyuridine 5'-triphosphate nucleotidohydrolase [Halorubrum californiense DSM 19288]TKX69785.1 deoxyuridine 5'-triphosphate nucleotidohydrolase [Halorubrum sp. GN11GM_10-3_MGM]